MLMSSNLALRLMLLEQRGHGPALCAGLGFRGAGGPRSLGPRALGEAQNRDSGARFPPRTGGLPCVRICRAPPC